MSIWRKNNHNLVKTVIFISLYRIQYWHFQHIIIYIIAIDALTLFINLTLVRGHFKKYILLWMIQHNQVRDENEKKTVLNTILYKKNRLNIARHLKCGYFLNKGQEYISSYCKNNIKLLQNLIYLTITWRTICNGSCWTKSSFKLHHFILNHLIVCNTFSLFPYSMYSWHH